MQNYFVPKNRPISSVHLRKNSDIVRVTSQDVFDDLISQGYEIYELDDVNFVPNEVTKVSDILALHSKGIDVRFVGGLNKQEILDDRSDIVKLSSPNLESDKLYPNVIRMRAELGERINKLNESHAQLSKDIENEQQRIDFERSLGNNNV